MGLDRTQASLGGTDLPTQFKYARPRANYRIRRVPTHGGVRLHTSPAPVLQDQQIQFTISDATEAELTVIRGIQDAAGVATIAFLGYWTGDSYNVKFFILDDTPSKAGNLFDITGTLEIVS
jgi:hypothetical protein